MTISLLFSRYYWLLKAISSPISWTKYRWILALPFFGGLLFYGLHGQRWMLVPSAVIVGIFLVMFGAILPRQMLILVSSKSLSLLPTLRSNLAVIFFSFTFIISALISLALKLNFISCFFIATMYMVCLLFISAAAKYQALIIFVVPFLTYISRYLIYIPDLVSVVLVIVIWAVFFIWWYAWRPTTCVQYTWGMTAAEFVGRQDWQWQTPWSIKSFLGKPHSFAGTLLIGRPDSWQASLSGMATVALLLCVPIFTLKYLLGHLPSVFHSYFLLLVIVVSACAVISMEIQEHFRGWRRLWLYLPQNRHELWQYLERTTIRRLCSILFVQLILFFLLSYGVFGQLIPIALYIYLVVATVLTSVITFYCSVIAYILTGDKKYAGLTQFVLAILLIALAVICISFWSTLEEIYTLWFVGTGVVLVAAIVIARARIKLLWPCVNFSRIAR